jgi:hypothetical protein
VPCARLSRIYVQLTPISCRDHKLSVSKKSCSVGVSSRGMSRTYAWYFMAADSLGCRERHVINNELQLRLLLNFTNKIWTDFYVEPNFEMIQIKVIYKRFPPRRPGFKPGSGHVGFCDGQKWCWGRFSPITSVPLPICIPSTSPQSSSLSPEAGTIGQVWPQCQ